MTAKISASADGLKVTIGNSAEDALEIDQTAKTIKGINGYMMAGNGPAFSAIRGQTNFSGVVTDGALVANVEVFDTDNAFSTVTGRFTPQVAGYYRVSLMTLMNGGNGNLINYHLPVLLKNGTNYRNGSYGFLGGVGGEQRQSAGTLSCLIYLNGSTDYIQAAHSSQVTALCSVSVEEFSASLVRAA